MGEQPLVGYSRKGFLRGRAVRLMTVAVRPGRPNAAASGFLPGIIREPLAGQRHKLAREEPCESYAKAHEAAKPQRDQ